jgi:hypothetical protein
LGLTKVYSWWIWSHASHTEGKLFVSNNSTFFQCTHKVRTNRAFALWCNEEWFVLSET